MKHKQTNEQVPTCHDLGQKVTTKDKDHVHYLSYT